MKKSDQQQLLTQHIHNRVDVKEVNQVAHNGRVVWFRITSERAGTPSSCPW
ncbi:MAG: hypothetical protein QXH39_05445 [Conexivisphaerales archaeon]